MRLYDWFYRQRVTEGEMDAGFGAVNTALLAMRTTQIEGVWMGALWGDPPLGAPQVPQEHAPQNMTVDIPGPLRAWDSLGNLLFDPTIAINVDCSADYQGLPTAVLVDGNEKLVTICVAFDWVLSDPRVDGNGDTVYFQKDPSVVYEVYQGAEAPIGMAVAPAIPADRVILCDVMLNWNDLAIADADIDIARMKIVRKNYDHMTTLANNGAYINFTATGFSAASGPTVGDALAEVDGWMTGHLRGTGPHHDSDDIDFDNAVSGLVATHVKGALDEIDNTVDGLVSGAAMWDTDVRFSGLMVDPSTNQAPVNGEIQLWDTAGQLYLRGDDGAAATDYSTLTFLPAQDGALDLVQGQNVANTNIFFDVQAFSVNAARIYNRMTTGNPLGLLVSVPSSGPTSFGIHVSVLDGDGYLLDFGGGTSGDQDGVSLVSAGGAAGAAKTGIHIEEHAGHNNCTSFKGLFVETHSAYYSASSAGAIFQNLDAGANGYVGLYLLPKDGLGIYSRQDGGYFFDVAIDGAGALGGLVAGTGPVGGLSIVTVDGTTYGLNLYPDDPLDTFTALLRMAQTATGLLLSGLMDPAQDSIELTSSAVVGDSAKAGIKVDYTLATTNDPVPFWGVCRTHAGYAFYAEKGAYAMQSPIDTDVFTWGVHDAAAWDDQYWNALLGGAPTGIACDYVKLAKDLEVPAGLAQRDMVTKRRIATAWAQCASAGGITGGHFNVLSVTNTAVGTYSIVLDIDGNPTGRSVQVTCSDRGTEKDATMACVTDPLANPIVVKLRKINDTAGAVNIAYVDEDFTFTVFQDR